MKKVLSLTLTLLLLFALVPTSVSAAVPQTEDTRIVTVTPVPEGGYMLNIVEQEPVQANARARAMTKGISATKTAYYVGSDGTLFWHVRIQGSFSYNGSSATCISATGSYAIYHSAVTKKEFSPSRSGNSASCYVKMACYGYTTKKTVTVTCSATGQIS